MWQYFRIFWVIIYLFISVPAHMAEKTALVLLANGAEEMEAVISIDVLRRGGVSVTVAVVGDGAVVQCSRGVKIQGDVSLAEALTMGPYDAVVLPGGLKGSQNLAESAAVKKLVVEQQNAGRYVAAICAAPANIFPAAGVAEGKKVTSYPALAEKLTATNKYTYLEDAVVVDGNIVTSRGPGTAFAFAIKLVELLAGQPKAAEISKAMLL